eukprot:Mrub_03918.p1 GENE.Mrub_03918~~Mrub_03918.p1  ORF type:complete len:442 (-),score=126.42 Mrub_03918:38-1273(-)
MIDDKLGNHTDVVDSHTNEDKLQLSGDEVELAGTSTRFKLATNSPSAEGFELNDKRQAPTSNLKPIDETANNTKPETNNYPYYTYYSYPAINHPRNSTICPYKQNDGIANYIYYFNKNSYTFMSDKMSEDSISNATSNHPTTRNSRKSNGPRTKTKLPGINDVRQDVNAALNSNVPSFGFNSALNPNRTGSINNGASNIGALNSTGNLGDMNPNDLLANIAIMFDKRFATFEERFEEHEAAIQDRVDAQDEQIQALEEHIGTLTNTVNILVNDVNALRNQPVPLAQPAEPRNGPRDSLLHVTGWPLLNNGDPWVPEPEDVAFTKFNEVTEYIEHTGDDNFICWVKPGLTYWAIGKALALHWADVRYAIPNLDIRSRGERDRNVVIDNSRFHRCTKTWDAAKHGNRKVRVGN